MSLLRDGWTALREVAVANAPDIVFRAIVFVLIILVFRYLVPG